jgi:hypothetical protein
MREDRLEFSVLSKSSAAPRSRGVRNLECEVSTYHFVLSVKSAVRLIFVFICMQIAHSRTATCHM